MRLSFETPVVCSMPEVWSRFDQELFLALIPRFPPTTLLRFDGCQPGDEVHLVLGVQPLEQRWESSIVSLKVDEDSVVFVDEGQRLPFFLRHWRHEHRLERIAQGTLIVDRIEYSAPFPLLEWMLRPALWWQFSRRRPVYQQYFGAP